ncbi:MAG TPA: hypothetical protein VFE28_01640, partial [Candidatus Krumholzibacteria bacterium]|nr:hypothetical protein [Candidatus Krumholzibacteria bacterium]
MRNGPGALALALAALLSVNSLVFKVHAGEVAVTESTLTSGPVPREWITPAEATSYRRTPDYDETMRYLKRLEQASRWLRLTSYGKSGQGRDLPLVIVSKERAFTPEGARASGK